ncbi:MAG: cysteine desulfurase [Clostridiales Family XIII bacterium]|jgi:cysteine desulfurase|nr:cysteine desulfurase [Clostridiales Family XIII bacterium]
MRVYLDNSATTPVPEQIASAVYRCLTENYGNPSSVHTIGQDAERVLKQARHRIASAMEARPDNIIFTGSGTEADNLALFSALKNPTGIPGRKIVISSVEHAAVSEPAAHWESLGARVIRVPVAKARGADASPSPGMIDMGFLGRSLDERTSIVSVMHVNNETGVIQPIGDICKLVVSAGRGEDVLIHTDAIQSYCKLPIHVESEEFGRVDLISLSAHKIHGPKGVGALYAARPQRIAPLVRGGGQEYGARSGTQNVPGIVGFGMAANLESSDLLAHARRVASLRKRLLDGVLEHIGDVLLNSPREASPIGRPGFCSPYILSLTFLGTRGEVLVHDLEQRGVFVSTGAACSSLKKGGRAANPVLTALGLSTEEAEGTLRFSFNRYNTEEEIDFALEHLTAAIARFRRIGAFRQQHSTLK